MIQCLRRTSVFSLKPHWSSNSNNLLDALIKTTLKKEIWENGMKMRIESIRVCNLHSSSSGRRESIVFLFHRLMDEMLLSTQNSIEIPLNYIINQNWKIDHHQITLTSKKTRIAFKVKNF